MTATALKMLARTARHVRASDAPGVPSPCQSVCRMESGTGWCEGCLRTLDEIAAWSRLDDAAKREVWRELERRLATRGIA
jgi:predicted Fe-S protein YdhL (DUF1289 family)